MKRSTQNILYHTLPIVFWLLAGVVCALPWLLNHLSIINFQFSTFNYLPAFMAWIGVMIVHHIPRHGNAVEPCFRMALLLGIAAYWLPSVLFLILPIWGYLFYRNLFNLRVLCATLIGIATIAIWVVVLYQLSIVNYQFSILSNLSAWLPTGAVLVAWLGSTIVRQTLRVR